MKYCSAYRKVSAVTSDFESSNPLLAAFTFLADTSNPNHLPKRATLYVDPAAGCRRPRDAIVGGVGAGVDSRKEFQ
jgi:hypothetical protein